MLYRTPKGLAFAEVRPELDLVAESSARDTAEQRATATIQGMYALTPSLNNLHNTHRAMELPSDFLAKNCQHAEHRFGCVACRVKDTDREHKEVPS